MSIDIDYTKLLTLNEINDINILLLNNKNYYTINYFKNYYHFNELEISKLLNITVIQFQYLLSLIGIKNWPYNILLQLINTIEYYKALLSNNNQSIKSINKLNENKITKFIEKLQLAMISINNNPSIILINECSIKYNKKTQLFEEITYKNVNKIENKSEIEAKNKYKIKNNTQKTVIFNNNQLNNNNNNNNNSNEIWIANCHNCLKEVSFIHSINYFSI